MKTREVIHRVAGSGRVFEWHVSRGIFGWWGTLSSERPPNGEDLGEAWLEITEGYGPSLLRLGWKREKVEDRMALYELEFFGEVGRHRRAETAR